MTGLTGLSGLTDNLPIRAIITDDPMRVRMLAAHWLENASVLYEERGMVGYTGSYKGTALSVLSVGYGESAAVLYLHDASLLNVSRFIYMGECFARVPYIRLRDVILAKGGDERLMQSALAVSEQFSLKAIVRDVTTCDRFSLDESSVAGDVVDFASGAVAQYAAKYGLAALSVLTVSRNIVTGERIDEHERQSRFNTASQLVFETINKDAGIMIRDL